jgi:uncharacterized protein YggE
MGAIFMLVMIVSAVKTYRFIGAGVAATNTIVVSGEAEVLASLDIATVSFTVRESAPKVSEAQDKVSIKTKAALAAVRKLGVSDKDIKTESYSSYPQYEWQQKALNQMCIDRNCPPSGKQVIIGYEVSQAVTVTVRNLESVNGLVDALAKANITEMQGPSFAIDKQDDLKTQARKQAIEKARAKAETLASDLGVTLVRVVSFSEGQNSYAMYGVMKAQSAMDSSTPAPAADLPRGQQKITSNVTVTYEIQ